MRSYELVEPLRTERLRLRPYTPADFEALYAMRSSPDVARYLYWEPQTEEEVRETLARKIGHTALRAEGDVLALAAEQQETGVVVADVILHRASEEHALGEIGYIAHPDHRGQGFGDRGGPAAARCGVRRRRPAPGDRPAGGAERRVGPVLEKLGFRREAHLVENEWVKGEWQSELAYAILDREWRAQQQQ